MNTSITPTTPITKTLDRLEHELPALPATWLRLNRAVVRAGTAQVSRLNSTFSTSVANVVAAGRTSRNTVLGQARAAGDQVVRTTVSGVRQVVGQAQAQNRRFADVADTETTKLRTRVGRQASDVASAVEATADEAATVAERSARTVAASAKRRADSVASTTSTSKNGTGRGYESWSKADLYARAQELDIEGRTSMSKAELVKALRAS